MSRAAVNVDVARLSDLPADALRLLWSRHVRSVPPRVSPGLLALALGHHLQTRRWGGLDAAAMRQLLRSAETGVPLRPSAAPGTRLVRAWQGKTHVVTIDEQGRILWNDRIWRSLSEVAPHHHWHTLVWPCLLRAAAKVGRWPRCCGLFMKRVRCAIYTRKSSEEGLEQDFNSLDAQYEACAAYILSQASEGWHQNAERYDDGGHSGGTLERPALKRLLNDVEIGLIDIIIVYKLDRLTRSLLDFAQLVARLDKAGVSFVSITQSFNTTTSMGRLTLNMLLSFAQFEREVTAERIRDKIAASKAKGMWMGGTPPLGYAPDGRSLSIVPDHATLIRHIYARYLDIGNVRLLAYELARDGICLPIRTTSSGRNFGGGAFTRGQLYRILSNPIYTGQISHGTKRYAGLHEAIIDQATWDRVQAKLADSVRGQRQQSSVKHSNPLAGLLFDQNGEPLVATHAVKQGRRYRYYVSRSLQHGGNAKANDGMRIPARDIETLVRIIWRTCSLIRSRCLAKRACNYRRQNN